MITGIPLCLISLTKRKFKYERIEGIIFMQRTNGKIEYKNCKINFTITQTDGKFSAFAKILCINNSDVTVGEVICDGLCDTLFEAQESIINKAKLWIDAQK